MIAPDSSVLVAGFLPSHAAHQPALAALAEVREEGTLVAHTVAETYAVLSARTGVFRVEPDVVLAYLDQFLAGAEPLRPPAGAYREAIGLLAADGRHGGAVYDALIALAAREAGVELVSLDRRAAPVYRLCGVEPRSPVVGPGWDVGAPGQPA